MPMAPRKTRRHARLAAGRMRPRLRGEIHRLAERRPRRLRFGFGRERAGDRIENRKSGRGNRERLFALESFSRALDHLAKAQCRWLREKLGGTRVSPRVECDLDYEEKFTAWLNAALGAFGSASAANAPATESKIESQEEEIESAYSRSNPFPALLITSQKLNADGSAKQVNHVEFDLTGSDLIYEAGDALGVFAHN